MIEKERLKELIKQEATIWKKEPKIVREIKAEHIPTFWCEYRWDFYCKDFFETKEDAEFALKYQNITRTETLSLPTWEKIQKRFENNNKFGGHLIVKFDDIQLMVFIDNYSKKFIELTNQPRKPLTKENYYAACELCRKLFLDEEVK